MLTYLHIICQDNKYRIMNYQDGFYKVDVQKSEKMNRRRSLK